LQRIGNQISAALVTAWPRLQAVWDRQTTGFLAKIAKRSRWEFSPRDWAAEWDEAAVLAWAWG
jgi:hypothetical protein